MSESADVPHDVAADEERSLSDAERRVRSRRGRRRRSEPTKPPRPFWVEITVLLVVALLVAVVVRTFLLGVYFIPSGSMENTLQIGDRVVVDKLTYDFSDIQRGDIVVFNGEDSFTPEGSFAPPSTNPIARGVRFLGGFIGAAPAGERDFIKRVVGVPGDRVACCDDQGRITVNGVPIDEPYLYPGDDPSEVRFDVVVPEGRLWVMGDHRSASADSRSHLGDPGGGTVPESRVIGRARAVLWPAGDLGILRRPAAFDQVPDPAPSASP